MNFTPRELALLDAWNLSQERAKRAYDTDRLTAQPCGACIRGRCKACTGNARVSFGEQHHAVACYCHATKHPDKP